MRLLINLFAIALISTSAFGQSSADTVYMVSGEIKIGSITGLSESTVDFVHKNESLTYHLQKADIHKIIFSSGRMELINSQNLGHTPNGAEAKNLVAILPFVYVRDGVQRPNDVLEQKAQNDLYVFLDGHLGGGLSLQNTSTTTSILRKHNITTQTISKYSTQELCDMLGVSYLIQGNVSIAQKGANTYNSNSTTINGTRKGATAYSSSSSSTVIEYSTHAELTMLGKDGTMMYNKEKESFFSSDDAYPMTIRALAKHLPYYAK